MTFAPEEAWKTVTDAPLKGLSLAREAGTVLAWDEGRNVYLLDRDGERIAAELAPAPILDATHSDDGTLIALLLGGPRLMLLDREFTSLNDRAAVGGAASLACDPFGRFVAVGTKSGTSQLYTRFGQVAGRVETKQPLVHLRFVSTDPMLIGANGYGSISALWLGPASSPEKLEAEIEWEERLLSNLGRLEVNGDGSLILASCYNLGIQRYDRNGHNEGSYHLAGTATHAVPDFAGRLIAAATLEGELYILNQTGNVRWKTALPRPAAALEFDALGRYLIYGLPTGEVVRLDLEPPTHPRKPRKAPAPSRKARAQPVATTGPTARAGSVRPPDWFVAVARSEEEAEAAVLDVLDEPPRIGFITRGNRLQVFDEAGNSLGKAPEINGVGRMIRTAPGWMVAATDRMIILYDARRNGAQRVDLSLFQTTHLIARPDGYGLAIIQERDRVGRATIAGRWVWRRELNTPVEDMALGPHGLTAVTTEEGTVHIWDAAGEPAGRFRPEPGEPLLMIEAPEGSTVEGLAFLTLARRAQVLRGHRADGRPLWESPVPFEGWALARVGSKAVVTAPDGRALAFDAAGYLRAQGGPEESPFVFAPGPEGAVWRVVRRDVHLICSDLPGAIIWRAVSDAPIGQVAAGKAGVAALLGRDLAFFATPGGAP
jgi:hypothetical protein